VHRVAKRFIEEGQGGLVDRREDNGDEKVTEEYKSAVMWVLTEKPGNFGYRRPTWTQELLVLVLAGETGVRISATTMCRLLRKMDIRLRRPKPIVLCPWKKAHRTRRIRAIQRLIATLPKGHVAVYADEVDIHLNPKIGPDWTLPGRNQETVLTPGKNEKRYLAGALNAKTGKLTWVEGDRKTSDLFIDQLWTLVLEDYPHAKCIHIILDNYRIHKSKRTEIALRALDGKVKLHFLPPYCPDYNKIERVWKDLHDNVTRNHRCRTMKQLINEVREYLTIRKKRAEHRYARTAAA
jgi:transposase